MAVLKAPPKHPKTTVVQLRVDEETKTKLTKYAEFLDCSPSYVVTDALKLVCNTRHSKRAIPLDPALASLLLSYRREAPPSQWVFPSSRTGRPWWPWVIQRTHLAPAGIKAGLGRIGWHTFRHTYSTMLRGLKVDVKVQQELLRHADIRTTLNIYTQAVPDAMRQANSKVVEMVLPERKSA